MFSALARVTAKAMSARAGALGFGASSVTLNIVTLICGVAILRWVGPELIGVWIKAQLLRVWMDVLRVGVPNGLNRELPELMGQGRDADAQALAATALAVTVVTTLVGAAIFGLATFLSWSESNGATALAMLTAAMGWVAGGYGQFVRGTMRSGSSFRDLARVQYAEALLALVSLVLVAEWGFHGLCVRGIALAVVPVVLLHVCRPMGVRPLFSAAAFRRICSSGLPQYVTNYLLALAANADRTLLLAVAQGAQLVGAYAPALAVTSALAAIPGSLTVYMYPRIVQRFGQSGEGGAVRFATGRMIRGNVLVLLPAGVAGVLLAPWLVRTFFPAYEEGIVAMQIAAGTGVLHALKASTVVLATLKAWRSYVIYAVLAVAAAYGGVKMGMVLFGPLAGAAAGTAAGLAASGLGLWLLARSAAATYQRPLAAATGGLA